jgi:hypothetical protein
MDHRGTETQREPVNFAMLSAIKLPESPMEGRYGDNGDMEIRILAAKDRDTFLSPYLPHPHIPLPAFLEVARSGRADSDLLHFSVSLCLCGELFPLPRP